MESLAYDSDPKQEKYVKGLNALGNSRKHIPVVLLEHKISAARVDTVMVDNRLSARKAVEHLIGCGRREIAHIVGPDYVSVSRMRLLGYQDALKENGIPFNEKLVVKGDFYLFPVTRQCAGCSKPEKKFPRCLLRTTRWQSARFGRSKKQEKPFLAKLRWQDLIIFSQALW